MGWGRKTYFTGYRNPADWASIGLVGDQLSFTTDETVTKLGLGYIMNQSAECAMDTAIRFTLLNAGENGVLSAKQMLNQHTRLAALVEENLIADGWYRPDATEENPNPNPVRGWVYEENMTKLWQNKITSEWYYTNAHFSAGALGDDVNVTKIYTREIQVVRKGNYYYRNQGGKKIENFTTHPVIGNERALVNVLDDKTVLKSINKSLNRMVKSGKARQVTNGRGRTFSWNAWNWLEKYRHKHLLTMAKQRKLGDVVNGWQFTKGEITLMYGVEICDHKWEPVEKVGYYRIVMDVPTWFRDSWTHKVVLHSTELPYLFLCEEEATDVCDQLNSNNHPLNGVSIRKNSEPQTPSYRIKHSYVTRMRLNGNAPVEDYMTPQEMFTQMQLGPEERYDALKKTMDLYPAKFAGSQKNKEE